MVVILNWPKKFRSWNLFNVRADVIQYYFLVLGIISEIFLSVCFADSRLKFLNKGIQPKLFSCADQLKQHICRKSKVFKKSLAGYFGRHKEWKTSQGSFSIYRKKLGQQMWHNPSEFLGSWVWILLGAGLFSSLLYPINSAPLFQVPQGGATLLIYL